MAQIFEAKEITATTEAELATIFSSACDALAKTAAVPAKDVASTQERWTRNLQKKFTEIVGEAGGEDWNAFWKHVDKLVPVWKNVNVPKDVKYNLSRAAQALSYDEFPEDEEVTKFLKLLLGLSDHIGSMVKSDPTLKAEAPSVKALGDAVATCFQKFYILFVTTQPMPDILAEGEAKNIFTCWSHKYFAPFRSLLDGVVGMYTAALYTRGGDPEELVEGVIFGCKILVDRLLESSSWSLEEDLEALQALVGLHSSMACAQGIDQNKVNDVSLLCRFMKIGLMDIKTKNAAIKSSLKDIASTAASAFANVKAPESDDKKASETALADLNLILDLLKTQMKKLPLTAMPAFVAACRNYTHNDETRNALYTVEHINLLFECLKKDPNKSAATSLFDILKGCSLVRPNVANEFVEKAVQETKNLAKSQFGIAYAHSAFQALGSLAESKPHKVDECLKDMIALRGKASPDMKSLVEMGLANMISGIVSGYGPGNASGARVSKELLALAKQGASEHFMPIFLMESTTILRIDRTYITAEHLNFIKGLSKKKGQYGTDSSALAFIDEFEGRTMRNFAKQIEEQNEKIKVACGSFDELKQYLDDNIAELKDFVGEVVKKLPVPCRFSSETKMIVQKIICLHFECPLKDISQKLVGGADEEYQYQIETKEWSKWMKMGLSAAKLGKSVITMEGLADVGDVLSQTKEIFKAYSKKDDEAFMTYCNEPFLTSDEQDLLVNGLRDGGFFKKFVYDKQNAYWVSYRTFAVLQECDRLQIPRKADLIEANITKIKLNPDDIKPLTDQQAKKIHEDEGGALDNALGGIDKAEAMIETVDSLQNKLGWICGCW